MRAMILEEAGKPLVLKNLAKPFAGENEIVIRVKACGVCRTDVHIADGDLKAKYPLIPGHQIVGVVDSIGDKVTRFKPGDSVGVPWLSKTCQTCEYCLSGRENLCDKAQFTGFSLNGGFAEYCAAHEDYSFNLDPSFKPFQAPLLCAGFIGYRAYRKIGQAQKIGLYGFGSSAHILIQLLNAQGKKAYVFTKQNDLNSQSFALELGAVWAGSSEDMPPEKLDAAIIFAPVGALYLDALKALKKGGLVVSAGIHMSDIPSFPYRLLWEERTMTSVANLTRKDGYEFLELVKKIPINLSVTAFDLEQANEAIEAIRQGDIEGSVILTI
ncbi:MAG: zinc-dependent alcohol dehydrogenase family protein [Parachlamydiaceae bacterium]